ncbi:MAG: molecular chaperone DnaJ, partial [Kiritimatiellae bacterium]|nr:molecular chaperone DnaJ [Kiritimatiellia bacterium]
TPDGKTFRLRGKGCPTLDGRGTGDLLARVAVEIPVRLTDRQKRALEDFQAAWDDRSYPAARAFRDRVATFFKAKEDVKGGGAR